MGLPDVRMYEIEKRLTAHCEMPPPRRPRHKYMFFAHGGLLRPCFLVASGEPAPPVVQHTPAGERTGWALGLRSRCRSSLPAHLPAHFVGCRGRAAAWAGHCGRTAAQLAARRVREGARGTVGIIDSALVQQYCQRNFWRRAFLSSCPAG